MDTLMKIQSELKAPKGNYNKFGKYSYRSCEDILEAVKPICKKYDSVLVISDKPILIGERYYIEATVTLRTPRNIFEVKAYAREEDTKKGMDASQITGTASSYARKYALNGLFCIDDTKDADSNELKEQQENRAKKEPAKNKEAQAEPVGEFQVEHIIEMCDKHHKDVANMCKYFGVKEVKEMTMEQYQQLRKIFKED